MEDHEHQERTARAYAVMEKKQADAIVRQLAGQDVGDLIYDIPFGSQNGYVDCGRDNCKYKRQGKKHTHVVGIGAKGVDELSRLYECIVAMPIRWRMVTDRGKRYWEVAALAVDLITGATRKSVYRQKADAPRDAGDLRGDFGFAIAQHKAKRNAVSEILPAALLEEVKALARQGKFQFSQADAREIMEPYIQARMQRKPRFNLMELLLTAHTGEAPNAGQSDLQREELSGVGEPEQLPPPPQEPPPPPARKPAKASKPPPKASPPPKRKLAPVPTFGPDSTIPGGQFVGQTWRAVLQSDPDYVKRLSEKAPNGWGKCAKDALAWWEKNKPEEPLVVDDDGFPVMEGEVRPSGRTSTKEGNEAPTAPAEAYSALFDKAGKAGITKDELDDEAQIRYGHPCDELNQTQVEDLTLWIG